jgi:hypothetical protein
VAPISAPVAVAIWSSMAKRRLVKRLWRWTVEPRIEFVATATELAPMATFWLTSKNRVRIGTRKTPPPSPSIEPTSAVAAETRPSSISRRMSNVAPGRQGEGTSGKGSTGSGEGTRALGALTPGRGGARLAATGRSGRASLMVRCEVPPGEGPGGSQGEAGANPALSRNRNVAPGGEAGSPARGRVYRPSRERGGPMSISSA